MLSEHHSLGCNPCKDGGTLFDCSSYIAGRPGHALNPGDGRINDTFSVLLQLQ